MIPANRDVETLIKCQTVIAWGDARVTARVRLDVQKEYMTSPGQSSDGFLACRSSRKKKIVPK